MDERNLVTLRPCFGIRHLQGRVTVGFEHLRPDDHRNRSRGAGKTNGKFRVPLPSLETMLGFTADGNVPWGSELFAEHRNGFGSLNAVAEHL